MRAFIPTCRPREAIAALALAASLLLGASPAGLAQPATLTLHGDNTIVAVVNGEPITRSDVDNRRRLFALSTGLPLSPDVLDHLSNQVLHELIDEHLRMQEAERRHIVVQDKEVAGAIADVEHNNNMPAGGLAKRLAAAGVDPHTLIDQFRAQIAWNQVLRQEIANTAQPTDADFADQEAQIKAQIGQTEYNLSEIFTSVSNPSQDAEALRFNDTIIQQLHNGAPFPVVAAQFSQSQTALQGGSLGWVQPNQLDPAVVKVVDEMPIGAISNPIKVAGGYLIVALRGKREIGKQVLTNLTVRQAFLPFTTTLNPQAPTPQQISQLEAAEHLQAAAHDCDAIEAANKAAGNVQPSDPGPLVLEQMANPQMRQLLADLPVGRASQPLPSPNGIVVLMVCSRESKNVGMPSHAELLDRIVAARLDLAARQLSRDLERRAMIDVRG
jgi:peptidyl-prolyl cis-trans isomerase SurA